MKSNMRMYGMHTLTQTSFVIVCVVSVLFAVLMLLDFVMPAHAEEKIALQDNAGTIIYRQVDGYEPYQGWQYAKWNEFDDPDYDSASGGTSRKGNPAWSLSSPLSIGVTAWKDDSVVTGSEVCVVNDRNNTHREGFATYKNPHYYKNIILNPIDATKEISFTFNAVAPGGAAAQPNSVLTQGQSGGIIIATTPDPVSWNIDTEEKEWRKSDKVVWEAAPVNGKIDICESNWWKNLTLTVPANTLEPNKTYYLAIKNNTRFGHAHLPANIVFEFSTNMARKAVWEGDITAAGYGTAQGTGSAKFAIESPAADNITVDLTKIDSCYANKVTEPMHEDDAGNVVFHVHSDGSGSNWQPISSWVDNENILLFDKSPLASGSYNIADLHPIATTKQDDLSKPAIICTTKDRDWPTYDGVDIAISNLFSGRTYWLVFTENFRWGNQQGGTIKPIVIEFSLSAADTSVLSAAIGKGQKSLEDVLLSNSAGKDIPHKAQWTDNASRKTLENALLQAQSVLKKDGVGQKEINEAVATLNSAQKGFDESIRIARVSFDALNVAIDSAEALKQSVVPSENGADVAVGKDWATQAQIDGLIQAIGTARDISNKNATQNEADEAATVLNATVVAFQKNTANPSKVSLTFALGEALALLDKVAVSVDGFDVVDGSIWCSKQEYDAMKAAIEAAQRINISTDVSQNNIDEATDTLQNKRQGFEATFQMAHVVTDDLSMVIIKTKEDLAATAVSDESSQVSEGTLFVVPEQANALSAAVEQAVIFLNKGDFTQNEVNSVKENLTQAQGRFIAAQQQGTMKPASLPSENLDDSDDSETQNDNSENEISQDVLSAAAFIPATGDTTPLSIVLLIGIAALAGLGVAWKKIWC